MYIEQNLAYAMLMLSNGNVMGLSSISSITSSMTLHIVRARDIGLLDSQPDSTCV
ncbi:hypothetical protein BDW42DRAFT_166513 [Aspergillus taichungensis]|uniref:Uncharacterized protein n=1 Tax=Aspergillus taichungensis TaxID=482145 RepID=A0A2J5HYG6_9EURO|nr:hypothetical protein BDW42DRAFT_166513 [Aspergillus taichungensis]